MKLQEHRSIASQWQGWTSASCSSASCMMKPHGDWWKQSCLDAIKEKCSHVPPGLCGDSSFWSVSPPSLSRCLKPLVQNLKGKSLPWYEWRIIPVRQRGTIHPTSLLPLKHLFKVLSWKSSISAMSTDHRGWLSPLWNIPQTATVSQDTDVSVTYITH